MTICVRHRHKVRQTPVGGDEEEWRSDGEIKNSGVRGNVEVGRVLEGEGDMLLPVVLVRQCWALMEQS